MGQARGKSIAAVSGIVVLGLTTACAQSGTSYSSPKRAVAASCHAATVRGVLTYQQDPPALQRINVVPGRTQVGWQASGQAGGTGWVALVAKHDSGYRVSNCKWKIIVHG
jgi:hypothetical protein